MFRIFFCLFFYYLATTNTFFFFFGLLFDTWLMFVTPERSTYVNRVFIDFCYFFTSTLTLGFGPRRLVIATLRLQQLPSFQDLFY